MGRGRRERRYPRRAGLLHGSVFLRNRAVAAATARSRTQTRPLDVTLARVKRHVLHALIPTAMFLAAVIGAVVAVIVYGKDFMRGG